MQRTKDAWAYGFTAWLVAAVSVLGALFLSEVVGYPPCVLCWYQRVFMFPLVLVIGVGLLPLDRNVTRYAMPLAALGWLIALFHVLLVAGVIPEQATPCTRGVPCAGEQLRLFGFVTIPLMSLVSFSLINGLLVAAHLRTRK